MLSHLYFEVVRFLDRRTFWNIQLVRTGKRNGPLATLVPSRTKAHAVFASTDFARNEFHGRP
jgi:hypothetical protein